MAIEFKCQSCGRSVRAPDNTGGKRGKCPYCGVSVYIPAPAAPDEEIGVAPLDESQAERQERLRRESIAYAASVDHDDGPKYELTERPSAAGPSRGAGAPRGAGPARGAAAARATPPREAASINVAEEVARFVQAMHASQLDAADKIAARLKPYKTQTADAIHGMLVDQMGPRIEGIPPALIQGFLRSLLQRLE